MIKTGAELVDKIQESRLAPLGFLLLIPVPQV